MPAERRSAEEWASEWDGLQRCPHEPPHDNEKEYLGAEAYDACLAEFFRAFAAQEYAALQAALKETEQWVNDLQSGMFINCVYCGHRYGPASSTPSTLVETPPPTVTMAEALKQHIAMCPKHPMSALQQRVEALDKALQRMRDMVNADHLLHPGGVSAATCAICQTLAEAEAALRGGETG